jgi:hypothetical protein
MMQNGPSAGPAFPLWGVLADCNASMSVVGCVGTDVAKHVLFLKVGLASSKN